MKNHILDLHEVELILSWFYRLKEADNRSLTSKDYILAKALFEDVGGEFPEELEYILNRKIEDDALNLANHRLFVANLRKNEEEAYNESRLKARE